MYVLSGAAVAFCALMVGLAFHYAIGPLMGFIAAMIVLAFGRVIESFVEGFIRGRRGRNRR